ncbi:glycoside hydrolase family 127 protein [Cellulomonas sp. ACRRI]|uniref:glycoside hydrolase family 127 protein n=1 Tax=Cellulomonas sp. ACRRI TaxID=2918188 RepID=UPI001EF2B1DC|nr:beta-L-arabinofuranosidase domain-containing protein [Cellulomonas sp. ACRRI]MCG7284925.1 glycoside hydrolase family 127 protein [Cellulomonas sp. ACRRI]
MTDPRAAQHGRPHAPSSARWQPLGIDEVRLDGGFWGELQHRNATAMIAHAEHWVEQMGWAGNFDLAAAGTLPEGRRGREFSDSEIYKLLEAMAWEVGRTGDADLDRRLRALASRVAAAQEPDGYISTMFGRPGQGARWSDPEWGHELYCIGHLIQAGVARARTHGDDELVQVAVRAADHVCAEFGPDGRQGVDGHPEIESALVELSRLTGERRYLDQARLFVERRGHGVLADIELGRSYFQDDEPVRSATTLRGHAVRALYLAAGAADVAVEDGDAALLDAVTGQVRSALARRTYLTGGMGAHHEGESFGLDFELPPDRAYAETCAGIASVLANHRLLLQSGDARHADAVERTLYNVLAASPSAEGTAFFYTNPLQQRVPGEVPDPEVASPRAASSLRAPWFHVSCCPTNVTRTVASLAAYVASTDDAGVQLHQYAPGTVATTVGGEPVRLRVETGYPHDGRVVVAVEEAPAAWTLTLRIPAWAAGATVDGRPVEPGYVAVDGPAAGGRVELDLPVAPRFTVADPRVDAVRGQVAVEAGPLVYALESVDLGTDVGLARVDTGIAPEVRDGAVTVHARTVDVPEGDWPYADRPAEAGAGEPRPVPLVPYHAWGNRGPSTMRVWMPVG